MVRALLELLPVLSMPGFAFGFGFGPQGPKSTTQGTYTAPTTGALQADFSNVNAQSWFFY